MTARIKIGMQLFAIVVLSIAIALVVRNGFAWTNPSINPPLGTNVINVSNGNAGIGTASPAYKLDVNGDINFTGTLRQNGVPFAAGNQWTTSGTNIFNANTGSVGIGTASPAYKLDVNGDIRTAGQLYGNGSQTAYGALSVNGTKNGWSGINFRGATANYGTLMMHPSYSGFYNTADNGWRWYVDDNGISYQPGYANVSDVYIRNAGKWASQLGGGPVTAAVGGGTSGAVCGSIGKTSVAWSILGAAYSYVFPARGGYDNGAYGTILAWCQ